MSKGFSLLIDPDQGTVEHETYTCFHCQHIKQVPHKCRPEDAGGICFICFRLICPDCIAAGICDPFEEKLKRAYASNEARRSYDQP